MKFNHNCSDPSRPAQRWVSLSSTHLAKQQCLIGWVEERNPSLRGETKRGSERLRRTAAEGQRSISVIMPAFNEQDNVEKAVAECRKAMSRFFKDIEIIVVNDGSTDNTAALLDRMVMEDSDLTVIHHGTNCGYGAALRSGIDQATKELIFFTDADRQFDLEEISRLLEYIKEYDLVIGYRLNRADPFYRRLNAWSWNMLVRLFLNLKVRDLNCAFKLFRREVFDNIRLETKGAMINTEILMLAKLKGMKIKEIPVSHYPRQTGAQTGANPRVILKALQELITIRCKYRKFRSLKKSLEAVSKYPDQS